MANYNSLYGDRTVRHIIPISGKDSLCTAIVQKAWQPNLPYEYVFCDVKMELPETYTWLDKVENSLGVSIIRIGKGLEEVIAEQNMLPSHHRRFCTKYGKIFPIEDFIGTGRAIQYLGFRADEDRVGAGAFSRPGIVFAYPLRELGIDLRAVYSILGARDLLPPNFFWQRLWDEVYGLCSDTLQQWLDNCQPWVKSHLFSWRSRSNCYMCFYQRLYEWVGLLEHHPELFQRAEELEWQYGSQEAMPVKQADFFFRQGEPLSSIRQQADSIFQDRVRKVHKAICEHRLNPDDEPDMLQAVSCGAYCGK